MSRVSGRGRRWRRASICLADVGAVEVEAVVAGLAFDGVAAVAGVPLEAVVAGSEGGLVGADVAVDAVVAVAAEEGVGAVAAAEVSLPSPPSIVSAVRVARPLPAAIVSLPSRPETTSSRRSRSRTGRCRGCGCDLGAVAEQRDLVGPWCRCSGRCRRPRRRRRGRDRAGDADRHRGGVVAAERRGRRVVERRLAAADPGLGGEAADDRTPVRAREGDLVGRRRPVGDHGVGRAVAAAADRVEVDVDRLDARCRRGRRR